MLEHALETGKAPHHQRPHPAQGRFFMLSNIAMTWAMARMPHSFTMLYADVVAHTEPENFRHVALI